MPYSANSSLPQSVRDKYSGQCQSVFRNAFNSTYEKQGEERAFQNAHAAARRCMERKSMPDHKFNIYSGVLKAYEADGAKRLKTVASSTITDRSGDQMTENAIRKMADSAKDNLTIFLNHSYKVPEDVFGSVEGVAVVQRGEVWDLDFDIRLNEANDRAVKTYDAILGGTKLGTSIGAGINEGGYSKNKSTGGIIFDDVTLLEASIVGIPANPRSWVQYARKSLTEEELIEEENTVTITTSGGGQVTVTSEDQSVLDKARVWVDVDEKGKISTAVDTDKPEPEAAPSGKKDEAPEVTKESEAPEQPEMSEPQPTEDDPSHPENNEPVGDPGNITPAQEVEATDPDSADDGGDETKALAPDAVKATDFVSLVDMLRTITGELVTARQAQVDADEAKTRAEADLAATREELEKAKQIVEQIANLPIGRRSVVQYHVNDFRTKFGGLYGDDFVKMLENKNNDGTS
jgi:cation transport regulator ChaB